MTVVFIGRDGITLPIASRVNWNREWILEFKLSSDDVYSLQRMTFIKWTICGLLIAGACFRMRERKRFGWFDQLTGWQKVFGILGLIAALLIVLNPEFLCLGLLGDAAFFDLLVVGLSLQLHGLAARLWSDAIAVSGRVIRWIRIPSPGMAYLMAMVTFVGASVIQMVQKTWNRIL